MQTIAVAAATIPELIVDAPRQSHPGQDARRDNSQRLSRYKPSPCLIVPKCRARGKLAAIGAFRGPTPVPTNHANQMSEIRSQTSEISRQFACFVGRLLFSRRNRRWL